VCRTVSKQSLHTLRAFVFSVFRACMPRAQNTSTSDHHCDFVRHVGTSSTLYVSSCLGKIRVRHDRTSRVSCRTTQVVSCRTKWDLGGLKQWRRNDVTIAICDRNRRSERVRRWQQIRARRKQAIIIGNKWAYHTLFWNRETGQHEERRRCGLSDAGSCRSGVSAFCFSADQGVHRWSDGAGSVWR